MKTLIYACLIALATLWFAAHAGPLDVSSELMLGVIPRTELTLYSMENFQQGVSTAATYVADYQVDAKLWRVGFVSGGITCFSTASTPGFRPFRLDFNLGAGARWNFLEAGWTHGCYHPIAPCWDRIVPPLINAAQNLFYVKFKIGGR